MHQYPFMVFYVNFHKQSWCTALIAILWLMDKWVRLFLQNRGEGQNFFPSTLRKHPHSLIYKPNDGHDCHTSAPYRRIRSAYCLTVCVNALQVVLALFTARGPRIQQCDFNYSLTTLFSYSKHRKSYFWCFNRDCIA